MLAILLMSADETHPSLLPCLTRVQPLALWYAVSVEPAGRVVIFEYQLAAPERMFSSPGFLYVAKGIFTPLVTVPAVVSDPAGASASFPGETAKRFIHPASEPYRTLTKSPLRKPLIAPGLLETSVFRPGRPKTLEDVEAEANTSVLPRA